VPLNTKEASSFLHSEVQYMHDIQLNDAKKKNIIAEKKKSYAKRLKMAIWQPSFNFPNKILNGLKYQ